MFCVRRLIVNIKIYVLLCQRLLIYNFLSHSVLRWKFTLQLGLLNIWFQVRPHSKFCVSFISSLNCKFELKFVSISSEAAEHVIRKRACVAKCQIHYLFHQISSFYLLINSLLVKSARAENCIYFSLFQNIFNSFSAK